MQCAWGQRVGKVPRWRPEPRLRLAGRFARRRSIVESVGLVPPDSIGSVGKWLAATVESLRRGTGTD